MDVGMYQLRMRLNGIQEVSSSILLISTKIKSGGLRTGDPEYYGLLHCGSSQGQQSAPLSGLPPTISNEIPNQSLQRFLHWLRLTITDKRLGRIHSDGIFCCWCSHFLNP